MTQQHMGVWHPEKPLLRGVNRWDQQREKTPNQALGNRVDGGAA